VADDWSPRFSWAHSSSSILSLAIRCELEWTIFRGPWMGMNLPWAVFNRTHARYFRSVRPLTQQLFIIPDPNTSCNSTLPGQFTPIVLPGRRRYRQSWNHNFISTGHVWNPSQLSGDTPTGKALNAELAPHSRRTPRASTIPLPGTTQSDIAHQPVSTMDLQEHHSRTRALTKIGDKPGSMPCFEFRAA
jgi:hypothetical protein